MGGEACCCCKRATGAVLLLTISDELLLFLLLDCLNLILRREYSGRIARRVLKDLEPPQYDEEDAFEVVDRRHENLLGRATTRSRLPPRHIGASSVAESKSSCRHEMISWSWGWSDTMVEKGSS